MRGASDLEVGVGADDAVLQMAAGFHLYAVHEHAVDDLHIAAQLAHGPQHAALYGALVRHRGPAPHLVNKTMKCTTHRIFFVLHILYGTADCMRSCNEQELVLLVRVR